MGTYRVAPMDRPGRIGTALFYALAVMFGAIGIMWPDARPMMGVSALLVVVAWFSWRIAPKRYDVTDEAVAIVRAWPFKDISIPLSEVREVRRVELSPWKTMRTFGVGGLFSYSGMFWAKEVGSFYAGVTDFSRAVLVAGNGSYVISPEDPDQFVADVRSMSRET